jgi:hypothetical protein
MVILLLVSLRFFGGLLVAGILAAFGYLLGSIFPPRHILGGLALVLIFGAAVGASIGGAVAWATLLDNRRMTWIAIALAVCGAFIGSAGGYGYALAIYGRTVVPSSPVITTTVLAADFAANVLPGVAVGIWSFRHGKL